MSRSEQHLFGNHDRSQAEQALLKLLVKEKLLDSVDLDPKSYTKSGLLLHLASSGYFDYEAGLATVARSLNIKRHHFAREQEREHLARLAEKPFKQVPLSRWQDFGAFPAGMEAGKAIIGFANPLDINALRALEFALGCPVEVGIAAESEIVYLLDLAQQVSEGNALELILQRSQNLELRNSTAGEAQLESDIQHRDHNAPPVIQLVNKILSDAVRLSASDIHITPQREGLLVRARIDGTMRQLFEVPLELKDAVTARVKVTCGMDIAEKRQPQDGRLRLKSAHGTHDLRVSTVPTAYGENVVIRLLSSEVRAMDFGSLGMPADLIERVQRALKATSKLNVVTGPTGSGKTSTLYASLLHLHDGQRNIITLEDPVEYRIAGVTQIQLNHKAGMTFAKGVRAILRQDPDIVFVGEIRDPETADVVMQMAQTGHLVLSTLHTNSAPAAITRLRDLGVAPYLIASSLGSVLAQRLVRRLCHCAKPLDEHGQAELKALNAATDKARAPTGCDECGRSGYHGRSAVFSFLEITAEIAEAIRNEAGEQEIIALARKNGYQSVEEAGLQLLLNGETSISEYERVIGPLQGASFAGTQAARVQPQETAEPASGLRKPRILLVEDDENTRHILRLVLERDMYEVVEAANGQEALEALYTALPDIVLSDIMMPKINGLELLTRIRQDRRLQALPVLMLTANDSEENELSSFHGGANDFVAKGSRTEILLSRLRRLL